MTEKMYEVEIIYGTSTVRLSAPSEEVAEERAIDNDVPEVFHTAVTLLEDENSEDDEQNGSESTAASYTPLPGQLDFYGGEVESPDPDSRA